MARKIPVTVRLPLQRIDPKSNVNAVCQEDLEKSTENALCLIFEHMQSALDNEYPQHITPQCVQKAIIWLKYFESHAERIYGSSAHAIPQAATNLIRRIQQKEVKIPFTARDVYHGRHWAGLSNADEVEEVLEYLIEKNCIKCSTLQTSGRPTKKYWVHPKILEQNDQ